MNSSASKRKRAGENIRQSRRYDPSPEEKVKSCIADLKKIMQCNGKYRPQNASTQKRALSRINNQRQDSSKNLEQQISTQERSSSRR